MHASPFLLLLAAATVGVTHAALPDHWAPVAVVSRTQGWSLARTARISALAGGGHVLVSLLLGGVIAVIGLQFQRQLENQQGHIVGAVLLLTGAGFLVWGLTGHGHPHEHRWHEPADSDHDDEPGHAATPDHDHGAHRHQHERDTVSTPEVPHAHEHAHAGRKHSHRHNHEAFIHARAELITQRAAKQSLAGSLAAIIVPFGVAASPDLTFLPVAAAASGYGSATVAAALAVFAVFTLVTFVALTVTATAAGYQMKGEWLEHHANTITSLLLVGIGIFVFFGL